MDRGCRVGVGVGAGVEVGEGVHVADGEADGIAVGGALGSMGAGAQADATVHMAANAAQAAARDHTEAEARRTLSSNDLMRRVTERRNYRSPDISSHCSAYLGPAPSPSSLKKT